MNTNNHDTLKAISSFLSRYTTCLMAVGVQTSRIERNAQRIAEAYGIHAEMTFFQKTMMMTLWDQSHKHSYTSVSRIQHRSLNFTINAKLSRLSWMIYDKKLSLEKANFIYEKIVSEPLYSRWLVLIMVACANASFCRLFQGDWISVGIVFVATLVGFFVKQVLQRGKWNEFAVFILCAFASSFIGSLGYKYMWGETPDMALGTSVLYLVPGVPLINGVMDIIDGHTVTGITRLVGASMLIVCIALGLSFTLFLTGVVTI